MTAQDVVSRTLKGDRVGISIELLPDVFTAFRKEIEDRQAMLDQCVALLDRIRLDGHNGWPLKPDTLSDVMEILNGEYL